MWSIFNIFKTKEQKRKDIIIANVKTFAVFEQYVKKGLLIFNEENHAVFISSTIIEPFLSKEKLTSNFLHTVANWMAFQHSQLVWETEWFKAEHKAVLEAKETNPNLTDTQIAAIRQKARETVEYDEEKFKPVDDFSFYVFNDPVLTEDSELLTIGKYNHGEITMN